MFDKTTIQREQVKSVIKKKKKSKLHLYKSKVD